MDQPPAMDLFPDGGFVRLRSVLNGTYVHADEDAFSVSLRPLGAAPSLNAVWKAEHWPVEGGSAPFLLLQGAAYGRYLAVSHLWDCLPNVVGRRYLTTQRDYDSPNLERPFMWRPYRANGVHGNDVVYLMNWGVCLCSGGWPTYSRYIPNTVTAYDAVGEVTYWKVETIPQSRVPLPLPPLPPLPAIVISDTVSASYPEAERQERRIRHVRATDEGRFHFDPSDWPHFSFSGRSVQKLTDQIWLRQAIFNAPGIRLCVRAGLHAVPIPLVTDLPHNTDMDIIAYNAGSAVAQRLVFPQYDVRKQ